MISLPEGLTQPEINETDRFPGRNLLFENEVARRPFLSADPRATRVRYPIYDSYLFERSADNGDDTRERTRRWINRRVLHSSLVRAQRLLLLGTAAET